MVTRAAWCSLAVVAAACAVDLLGPGLLPRAGSGLSTTVCGKLLKPAIGLGTWLAPAKQMEQVVFDALRVGYRHIDCAPRYSKPRLVRFFGLVISVSSLQGVGRVLGNMDAE
jgi:hypothetical protein